MLTRSLLLAFAIAVVAFSAPLYSLPSVSVGRCGNKQVSGRVSIAAQADDKAAFPAKTVVDLCYTDEALHLAYEARDEKLFLNHYDKCNTDMWNNEVVEIFLAPAKGPGEIITEYHEVECSPHNALYVAKISNPYGNGTNKSNTMVDCGASGVKHAVKLERENHIWSTNLTIPWSLVTDTTYHLPKEWRMNLFRVLMLNETAPICDDNQCRYGAWSPTGAFPSNYHISTALGSMTLV